MSVPTLYAAHGLQKRYRMGDVEVTALRGMDLEIGEGRLVVILGPSGSGKSTLLNLLGGLDAPSEGTLTFRDLDLSSATERELTRFRREHVGFVFQFYNLVPSLTALENVALAADLSQNPLDPAEALAIVGLSSKLDRFPAQMSGGEQQRVAIARALSKRPDVLLCDEPTGALDVDTGRMVLGVLAKANRDMGTTTLLITHNAGIAALADDVFVIRDGQIARHDRNAQRADVEAIAW